MIPFMTKDFLLETSMAKRLFFDYAEHMPIFDYHCHLSAKEIYEDNVFDSLGSLWLDGDHYKWRIMRAAGIPEKYITGSAPIYDKMMAFAKTLPLAIGNPIYHWSHLELQRYFGITVPFDERTAPSIMEKADNLIKEKQLSPRKMIVCSHVKTLCTTEDPTVDFTYHERLAKQFSDCKVLPAWRPDKALKINETDFIGYLAQLEVKSHIKIKSYGDLLNALENRMDDFALHGCIASDHDINRPIYIGVDEASVESLFQKRLQGNLLTEDEYHAYRSALLLHLAKSYHKRNWAMELHVGCNRNQNHRMTRLLGESTGFDSTGDYEVAEGVGAFLDALASQAELPKTILFSLNPKDNWILASLANTFQGTEIPSKIQLGAAWWMQDHKYGMEQQLIALSSSGLLGTFIGMLTDSRSFLSYSRHEYFRRILCNFIGNLVENGEYPMSENLGKLVENICYNNATYYFKI
jgi:glucuronate isomerase